MASTQPSWPEIVSEVEHGVVQVITSSGSGSGFVVSAAGHVITNAHVVANAKGSVRYGGTVTVQFLDNVKVDGIILDTGIPDNLDLACLQVIRNPLKVPLSLGNSDLAKVGEPVIAVGYPVLPETPTVRTFTEGIVSAKLIGELRTSAAINPGNSGGPLIDRRGNVIGVNTRRIDKTPGDRPIAGGGIAIAANAVKGQFPFLAKAINPAATPEPETPAPTRTETKRSGASQHIIFSERFSINLLPPWELSPGSTPNFARFQSDVSSLFLYLVETRDALPIFADLNHQSLRVRATTWASREVGKLVENKGKQSFHFDYQGEYRDGDGGFQGRYNFSSLACGGQSYILFAGLVTWKDSPDAKAGLSLVLDDSLRRLKPT